MELLWYIIYSADNTMSPPPSSTQLIQEMNLANTNMILERIGVHVMS